MRDIQRVQRKCHLRGREDEMRLVREMDKAIQIPNGGERREKALARNSSREGYRLTTRLRVEAWATSFQESLVIEEVLQFHHVMKQERKVRKARIGFFGVASNHFLHADGCRSVRQLSVDCGQGRLKEVDTAPIRVRRASGHARSPKPASRMSKLVP